MKHMKFKVAEPILGIQEMRNYIFMGDEKTLYVLRNDHTQFIIKAIRDAVSELTSKRVCTVCPSEAGYNSIKLHGSFTFKYTPGEICLMHGKDDMWVEDDCGNKVSHDYDIDVIADIQRLKELKEGKLC